nr:hypothetical protein Iba_chr11cCG4560 [Ipomoea batatas]
MLADRRFGIRNANIPLREKLSVERRCSGDGEINAVSERAVGVEVSVEERELESGGDEVDDQSAVGVPARGFTKMRLKEGRGGELAAKAKGKRKKAVRKKEEAIAGCRLSTSPALHRKKDQLTDRLINDDLRNPMIRCIGEMNAVPMHGVSRARAYVSAIGPARRFLENFQESAFVVAVNDHNALAGEFSIERRQSASCELRRQAPERERAGNQDPFCSEPDDPFNSVNNCGDDVRNESPSLFNRPSLAEEGEIVVPAKFSEYEKRILLEALRRISTVVDVRFEPLQLLADRRFEIGGANVPLRKKILVARCRSSDGKINAVSERTVGVQVSVNEREIESGSDEIDDQAAVGEASCGFTEVGFPVRKAVGGVKHTSPGKAE